MARKESKIMVEPPTTEAQLDAAKAQVAKAREALIKAADALHELEAKQKEGN